MGNKQAVSHKIYKNVDVETTHESFTASPHSSLPHVGTQLNSKMSGSDKHLHSVNSTRSSFSHSFTASHSHTYTADSSYPELPPLQQRIDEEVLFVIITYMDILSRIQLSICCKHFNSLILSEKCLSDVWIIHGLTFLKNTLWEVPIPNIHRYHRKMRSHQKHQHQHHALPPPLPSPQALTKSKTAPESTHHSHHHNTSTKGHRNGGNDAQTKHSDHHQAETRTRKTPLHRRAASASISSQFSSMRKKNMLSIGSKSNKRRKSQQIVQNNKQSSSPPVARSLPPRSLPPEKIFGIEDVKDAEELIIDDKVKSDLMNVAVDGHGMNSKRDAKFGSFSMSKSSSNTILSGKNLIISTSNDHGVVIIQQHHRVTSAQMNSNKAIGTDSKHKHNKNMHKDSSLLNVHSTNVSSNAGNHRKKSLKKHRKYSRFFHELADFNVIVADFKKYLLQFSPIIKYARCLVVGADGLPKTLRDFSKLRWIPTVMNIEYLVLEQTNDVIACEILNSFAHSLKYLSIRGEIDESLDLYDLNIYALRISMNFNQPSCSYLWHNLPSTLRYLCLYKTRFNAKLLNETFANDPENGANLYRNLLHLSLIECSVDDDDDDDNEHAEHVHQNELLLPPSLISLHLKKFNGALSCIQCRRLWEIVIHVDMNGHNQSEHGVDIAHGNGIDISQLMQSLQVCSSTVRQIVFYEYNNSDELVLPNQLQFADWKRNEHGRKLRVTVPEHWLNDEKFKAKFENATFCNIKMDIVYYYETEEKHNVEHDNLDLVVFDEKEKVARKELRQRVGYSVFADFYSNHHYNPGEFNLAKFVRNGHHTHLGSRRQ